MLFSEFVSFNRLYLVIRGIKKSQGNRFHKVKRTPITPSILQVIRYHLFNSSRLFEDKLMLWAAMLCAFFGFMRVSEYTSTHVNSFDIHSTLCISDLVMKGSGCTLNLKCSKTDPFRVGIKIRLASNNSILCPVKALQNFISTHPTKSGPLFMFKDGSYLTSSRLSRVMKTVIPDSADTKFSTHYLLSLDPISHSFHLFVLVGG